MGACDKEVLDGVLFFGFQSGDSFAAPFLRFVDRCGQAFDVTLVRDRHDHGLLGDEVFHVVVSEFYVGDFRHAVGAVFAGDFDKVLSDDPVDPRLVTQDISVAFDFLEDCGVLLAEFLLL